MINPISVTTNKRAEKRAAGLTLFYSNNWLSVWQVQRLNTKAGLRVHGDEILTMHCRFFQQTAAHQWLYYEKKGKILMMQWHCNIRYNPCPTSSHADFFPRHLLYPLLLVGHPVLQWMENTKFIVLNLTMVGSFAGLAFSLNNSHCLKTQTACNKKT